MTAEESETQPERRHIKLQTAHTTQTFQRCTGKLVWLNWQGLTEEPNPTIPQKDKCSPKLELCSRQGSRRMAPAFSDARMRLEMRFERLAKAEPTRCAEILLGLHLRERWRRRSKSRRQRRVCDHKLKAPVHSVLGQEGILFRDLLYI